MPLPPEGDDRYGGDGPLYALSMFSSGVAKQWEIFPWCTGLHFSPSGEAKSVSVTNHETRSMAFLVPLGTEGLQSFFFVSAGIA